MFSRTRLVAASILVALLTLASRASAADDAVRVEKDVAYLDATDRHKADLYLPANVPPGTKCPGVVIIHGGGWASGDKGAGREQNIGNTLAANGYVGMSINYVLYGKEQATATWPQNLQQCKTAVRWLRKNAERLHLDPDHIGAIGGSAGGHLTSMLAVTGPKDGLDPSGPYGEFSCQIQAAVDLYGPADLITCHDIGMLGKKRSEDAELYRKASPATYADKDDPPILILHGTADKTVDVQQSKDFDAVLTKAGTRHELILVPGAPHTFHLQPKQRDLRPVVLGFFDRYLKGQ